MEENCLKNFFGAEKWKQSFIPKLEPAGCQGKQRKKRDSPGNDASENTF